ncbi:hypothetical protein [Paucibacter sp. KCTC 42545]|uniref:hypothetical protein n=1 Tax=Paucibacter sp. KCTC 42545 TaxID=1768242 RepID=UPI0012E3A753|nr:hypothetical protein [Paucibacter sp. KCTC 42545]
MSRPAQITGTVEYREGEGAQMTIRKGRCEVEESAQDVTLSWSEADGEEQGEGVMHGSAAIPLAVYKSYVASRAIELLDEESSA